MRQRNDEIKLSSCFRREVQPEDSHLMGGISLATLPLRREDMIVSHGVTEACVAVFVVIRLPELPYIA
jgi:hypothetical protein